MNHKKRFELIIEAGCIACINEQLGISPPEIHHLVEGRKRLGHKFTIGLCFLHHREGSDCDQYVSRHPHKAAFEARYGSEYDLLEQTNKLIEQKD